MTFEDVYEITERFYAHFCGEKPSRLGPGVHFIEDPRREQVLKGFGCKYPLYILERDGQCVVSYAPRHRAFADSVRACGMGEIVSRARRAFALKEMHLMVFARNRVEQYGQARVLRPGDYPLYQAFFREAHPGARPEGWLEEYFLEKNGYFVGYEWAGRLACVCDAPDMPYMEGEIQHTGIYTLKEARRMGFARRTAALAARHLMEMGVCPQWECALDNQASFELAKSVGYEPYGRAYILVER